MSQSIGRNGTRNRIGDAGNHGRAALGWIFSMEHAGVAVANF